MKYVKIQLLDEIIKPIQDIKIEVNKKYGIETIDTLNKI